MNTRTPSPRSRQPAPQAPHQQRLAVVATAVALMFTGASALAQTIKEPFGEFEQKELITADQGSYTLNAPSTFASSGFYKLGFSAVSQYDAAAFGRNFIPPDTMGAVGATQFMAVTNGAYGVFDKNTGARLSAVSDLSFWQGLGMAGANGDTRILYNSTASRWMMVSFGSSVANLQIAVSDTSNALGSWKATTFTGFAGGTADYPTLAMDQNSIYIGTNNFNSAGSYSGTTLNVIPVNSLFNAVAPTTTNMKQFVTPYVAGGTNADRGYAIQGVNSATATGKVVAASAFVDDYVGYSITGQTASSATAATQGALVYQGLTDGTAPGPARQPAVAVPGNARLVDTSDGRVSSSAYQVNAKIYMVETIAVVGGADEARVRWTVLDATTMTVLAHGDIGQAGYDYYQGSIAVNADGKVVIGYNRSGSDVATGKISLMAQAFDTAANGALVPTSGEVLLKTSVVDDYHNGTVDGLAGTGRQRWGDYSQVTVDPTDPNNFYVIGEIALEYNNAAGGHPGGTGGSRWGTWVAELDVSAVGAVPEPATWLMMLGGFAAIGSFARRRQVGAAA